MVPRSRGCVGASHSAPQRLRGWSGAPLPEGRALRCSPRQREMVPSAAARCSARPCCSPRPRGWSLLEVDVVRAVARRFGQNAGIGESAGKLSFCAGTLLVVQSAPRTYGEVPGAVTTELMPQACSPGARGWSRGGARREHRRVLPAVRGLPWGADPQRLHERMPPRASGDGVPPPTSTPSPSISAPRACGDGRSGRMPRLSGVPCPRHPRG